ncbi:ABC transporter substrate-binding protein [Rubellimicrobium roseum]|uniref:Extracellular solute-binding protein n=1 Tax=Rubellimicrobium roseum TaxID=687525 RepID=A0A5C4NCK2_9RHOB|nr:extracellular solute-binding protein [Rubellimicrobium roseum]TNC65041.1 extracellular solute-binding protein [Rubellimicrobium roseum]
MTPWSRACLSAAAVAALPGAALAQELNALVWCDHADPALVEPFEQAHGVRVNLREYEGSGAALATLEQSQPGDWDVLVIDAIDVPRVVEAGLMAELPVDQLPTADFFPQVLMEASTTRDGKVYAVTEKFGYNTISFNSAEVDAEDMQSLGTILTDEYAGRIAIYDYYLPVMGLAAVSLGMQTADLAADDLPALREMLFAMKERAATVGEVVASQTALATGEVDIVIGGGEFLTAVLAAEQPEMTWTIPDQGAVLWAQSIGVLEGSQNKDLALEFVKYIVSPEGQARLATSSCYWGMPANRMAGEHLTDEQKAVLRWDEQEQYLSRAQLYPAPDADLDTQMQDLWLEMLQR